MINSETLCSGVIGFGLGFLFCSLFVIIYVCVRRINVNENYLALNDYKIYYSRDNAGLNNIRLQFETMIVLAYLTKRTLMIPKPSIIDHYEHKFNEFDILDYSKLNEHVRISLYDGKLPSNIYMLNDKLYKSDYKKFPKDKHWHFNSQSSRVQHYQCLILNKQDQKKANYVISNAIAIKDEIFDLMNSAKKYIDLPEHEYNSIHLRRGDFKRFAKHVVKDSDEICRSIRKHLKPDYPIFITTNPAETVFIKELKEKLNEYQIKTNIDYKHTIKDGIQQSISDMLICANAKNFYGTPLSTFSTGIIQLRRILQKIYNKNIDVSANSIIPNAIFKENYSVNGLHGQCWDKLTNLNK